MFQCIVMSYDMHPKFFHGEASARTDRQTAIWLKLRGVERGCFMSDVPYYKRD